MSTPTGANSLIPDWVPGSGPQGFQDNMKGLYWEPQTGNPKNIVEI